MRFFSLLSSCLVFTACMRPHAHSAMSIQASKDIFVETCEKLDTVSFDLQSSVKRLLKIAATEDCELALLNLKGQRSLNLRNIGLLPVFTRLDLLVGLHNLEELTFDFMKVGDLGPLAHLPKLSKLVLTDSSHEGLGPKDFTHFPELQQLKILGASNLSPCPIESLAGVERFPNVEMINLPACPISSLKPLNGLAHLKSLYVPESRINDLSGLESSPGLELLDIAYPENGYGVTDASQLASLPNLKQFIAAANRISNLEALRNHPSLEWIELHQNNVSEVGILASIPSLTRLDLDDNLITDISSLSTLEHIEVISVQRNPLKQQVCPWADTQKCIF